LRESGNGVTGTRIGQQQQSAVIQKLEHKVSQLTTTGPAFSDPTQIFRVTPGPAAGHVQIAFRIAKVQGIQAVAIYRNLSRDFGSATQLAEFTAAVSEANLVNYADISAAIAGKLVFYWLRITPANPNNTPILHGPQSIVSP
jgi:hypothetical protein